MNPNLLLYYQMKANSRFNSTQVMKVLKEYVASLLEPEFIPSGIKTAAFVGSLLFLVNHGSAFLRKEMTRERWTSVVVTYAMPYLVNVYGQYSYRRKLITDKSGTKFR